MDKELQKVTNELCDLLRPVNIKLEKWIVENKKRLIASDGKLTELLCTYAVAWVLKNPEVISLLKTDYSR